MSSIVTRSFQSRKEATNRNTLRVSAEAKVSAAIAKPQVECGALNRHRGQPPVKNQRETAGAKAKRASGASHNSSLF